MCASHLDCHAVPQMLERYLAPIRGGTCIRYGCFQRALSFSVRRSAYSHIIRERPGSWHRRKGLEPSSGGFGDRCSTIKLRLYMSPMPGLEPGSVRTQLRVHRPGGLCLPPCECRYRLTGISELMRTRSPPKRVRTAVCPVTCRASCPYHTCQWVVSSFISDMFQGRRAQPGPPCAYSSTSELPRCVSGHRHFPEWRTRQTGNTLAGP